MKRRILRAGSSFSIVMAGWAEGDCSVEFFVGGDLVDVLKFRLTTE